jgi:hypothetical protein
MIAGWYDATESKVVPQPTFARTPGYVKRSTGCYSKKTTKQHRAGACWRDLSNFGSEGQNGQSVMRNHEQITVCPPPQQSILPSARRRLRSTRLHSRRHPRKRSFHATANLTRKTGQVRFDILVEPVVGLRDATASGATPKLSPRSLKARSVQRLPQSARRLAGMLKQPMINDGAI